MPTKKYEAPVERGFIRAAKFLHMLHIYRIFHLPYQSRSSLSRPFLQTSGMIGSTTPLGQCSSAGIGMGVFGELYGSAVETRIARDFMEVPVWLKGGPEPSTVSETMFRASRLKTMRMRLSAAYRESMHS
jgi:hypothetical protein